MSLCVCVCASLSTTTEIRPISGHREQRHRRGFSLSLITNWAPLKACGRSCRFYHPWTKKSPLIYADGRHRAQAFPQFEQNRQNCPIWPFFSPICAFSHCGINKVFLLLIDNDFVFQFGARNTQLVMIAESPSQS